MVGHAGEGVARVACRVEVVEADGLDQREDAGGALSADTENPARPNGMPFTRATAGARPTLLHSVRSRLPDSGSGVSVEKGRGSRRVT